MADLIDRVELRKDFCNMCEAMQPEMIDCNKKGCMSMQIIDEQPAVNRWISVEDALPDAFIYVICAGEEGMAILRYNGEVWVDDAGCVYSMSAITHWMPLPEPPEKE